MNSSGFRRRIRAMSKAKEHSINGKSREKLVSYRVPTQTRGLAKFETILDAVDDLLVSKGYNNFSIYDVAATAGVATGSVYHFFPNLDTAFLAVYERYDLKAAELLRQTAPEQPPNNWEEVLLLQTESYRAFMNSHPAYLTLAFGPGRTWLLQQSDVYQDILEAMLHGFSRYFKIPVSTDPIQLLHNVFHILDGLWGISYVQEGTISDKMAEETRRAVTAYLQLYWPTYLEPSIQDE